MFLQQDHPQSALDLVDDGANDVLCVQPYPTSYVRESLGLFANAGGRAPYRAIYRHTTQFNPRPGDTSWATVIREGRHTKSDRDDEAALRLLSQCHKLPASALPFVDAPTARPFPPIRTNLVLALLSAERDVDSDRVEWLSRLRSLENQGRVVIYLRRTGCGWPADLPKEARPNEDYCINYYSSIHLLMWLWRGFS